MVPLASPRRCPGFRPCRLCPAGRPVRLPGQPPCVPFHPQLVPKRPAAGPEEPGWRRHPLGRLHLEPGKREPWTPGGARSPPLPRGAAGENETAASVVSACQVRQENWGGCWRRGRCPAGLCRERGALAAGLQPPIPPPPHPHPQAPVAHVLGFRVAVVNPHVAPPRGLRKGMEISQTQISVVPRAEHQPRGSQGRTQPRAVRAGSSEEAADSSAAAQ